MTFVYFSSTFTTLLVCFCMTTMTGSLILPCEFISQILYFEVLAGSRGACVSLDNGPPAEVIGTEDRLYRRCRRRFPPVPFFFF